MKKITLTSVIAMCAIAPAMATPTNTSSTFPNDELMQADYTYTGQATYPNTGVYDGNVTAQAQYDWTLINLQPGYWLDAGSTTPETCMSGGYYCPGATGIHYDSENYQGIFECVALGDGSYTSSDEGATSENDCYKNCTLANISHAIAISGRDYYGTGVDTCAATLCEGGYHVNNGACVVNTINITWNGATAAAISANEAGTMTYGGDIRTPQTYDSSAVPVGKHFTGWKFVKPQASTFDLTTLSNQVSTNGTQKGFVGIDASQNVNGYGFSKLNEFGITFSYGKIRGEALCSSTSGTYRQSGTPDENTTGQKCWCRITGYQASGESAWQNVSPSNWVFRAEYGQGSFQGNCDSECVQLCATSVNTNNLYRSSLYGISNN